MADPVRIIDLDEEATLWVYLATLWAGSPKALKFRFWLPGQKAKPGERNGWQLLGGLECSLLLVHPDSGGLS